MPLRCVVSLCADNDAVTKGLAWISLPDFEDKKNLTHLASRSTIFEIPVEMQT